MAATSVRMRYAARMSADLSFVSLDARVVGEGLDGPGWATLRERWGYPAVSGAGTPPSRTLLIRRGAVPLPPPVDPVMVQVVEAQVPVWAHGDELWLGPSLHLHLQGRDGALTAAGGAQDEAAWLLAFSEAHRAAGWLTLHAAVVERGGRATAISGVSGAGKSTAALRLSAAGLDLLAEDHTWVWPHTGVVVGLDAHLRALDDSVRLFAPQLLQDALERGALGRDAHGKLLLPLLRAAPPAVAPTLEALLVFGLPSRPSRTEQVRALWEISGVPLSAAGRRAASQGVTTLLARLAIQGVSREDVVRRAVQTLEAHPATEVR